MRQVRAGFLFLTFLTMLSGCGSGYGERMEFNGGELYHTATVTADEATRLGQYLVAEEFFDGNEKTVQLNKNGSTYEFRFVVKKGLEDDPEFIATVKAFASELSEDVFDGNQVDIHLCDEYLETVRAVVVF